MRETVLIDAKPKFNPLQVVATPGAAEIMMGDPGIFPRLFTRHVCGDWGDCDDEDWKTNDRELVNGGRVMSAFKSEGHPTLWLITEWDRSLCTVLLPSEY